MVLQCKTEKSITASTYYKFNHTALVNHDDNHITMLHLKYTFVPEYFIC